MSEPVETPPATTPRPRPFLWSVRRELWEHRSIVLAPLAIAAVVLLAFAIASHAVPAQVRASPEGSPKGFLMALQAMAAGAPYMISLVVAVFYCLGAFNGERRDRSLLFWKSLPVSDRTTVLAKAVVPVLVQPAVVFAIALAAQLAMAAWITALVLVNGIAPQGVWSRLDLPFLWTMMAYGFALNALWLAPIYGWLLLVSAWAQRATFVWAVAPWAAICLFEYVAFRTRHVLDLLDLRFFGGMALAVSVEGKGRVPIASLTELEPERFFGHPGLWGGLLFFALCLAACVWLRRRHDPI